MAENPSELYQLDPTAFVAARDAMARALRSSGDRSAAAEVKKLRRPPVTAWALNRVALRQRAMVQAVLDAGHGLRSATDQAVAGDPSGMRTARRAERSALDAALTAAAGHLEELGHPASAILGQRMEATLHAAMVDPGVAARLTAGTLDQDHQAPGLGLELSAWPEAASSTGVAPPEAGDEHEGETAGETAGDEVEDEPAGEEPGDVGETAGEEPEVEATEAPEAVQADGAAEGEAVAADVAAGLQEDQKRLRLRVADLEDEADRQAGRAARLGAQADEAEREAVQARARADQAELDAEAAREALRRVRAALP